MNDKRHDSLLYSLDRSIELFAKNPLAHGSGAAAFDALKQARAMVAAALAQERAHCHPPARNTPVAVH